MYLKRLGFACYTAPWRVRSDGITREFSVRFCYHDTCSMLLISW